LIRYLGREDIARPKRIDEAPTDPKAVALVEAPFKAGTLTLQGAAGEVTLIWAPGEGQQTRGVPPGDYRVRTTREERMQKGVRWFVSSTGPVGAAQTLAKAKTTHLPFEGRVHFGGRAVRKRDVLSLGMQIQDADGHGLSIYRKSKRIEIRYVVKDKRGKRLAEGKMNYG